eukprot:7128031-Heterocapsa_arctica.AAC.1
MSPKEPLAAEREKTRCERSRRSSRTDGGVAGVDWIIDEKQNSKRLKTNVCNASAVCDPSPGRALR